MTGIVPTNTYPCKDGKHVIIGGNGDSIYVRLMNAIGRSDLVSINAFQKTLTLSGFDRLGINIESIQIESKNKRRSMVPSVSVQLLINIASKDLLF